jgi:P-type Ca2+ transporter type 2C
MQKSPKDESIQRSSLTSGNAHAMTEGAVAQLMNVQPAIGLDAAQASLRLKQFGPNQLPDIPPRTAKSVFIAQFKSVLILILAGAAGLSAMIGNQKDAIVILAVVLVNATVGFYQEWRAEQSLLALKKMLPARARVRRAGQNVDIPAAELVPGDVVLLEAGDSVPSDGRLWFSAGLEVDESALTGESQPASKHCDTLHNPSAALADRSNMVYLNTLVTRGRAEMVVTVTGANTEMGKLSVLLATTPEAPTPLQIQLDQLGKRLGAIALTLVGLLALIEFFRGTALAHVAVDAIALGVAAMPEGLPVVVTVTLALGMRNMAQQHAIVKRLASVETLGCTTVICSDKTGTLTLNQMTVTAFWYQGQHLTVTGEGYGLTGAICHGINTIRAEAFNLDPLMTAVVNCNDSRLKAGKVIGDPMEAALLVLAHKAALPNKKIAQASPRIAEIPFDSLHKFMATFHHGTVEGTIHMFIKGAPDVLISRCNSELTHNATRALDTERREQLHAQYEAFGNTGLRGLLVAARTMPAADFDPQADLTVWVSDLTFVALIGLVDPPRSEAREAITQCAKAGIEVKMITGDHQVTALAIARELGLTGQAMTGAAFDQISAAELPAMIGKVSVFARVTPSHKLAIVRALQKNGHVVAMTGDGVNDAPALKSADIGVAMGSGTAVAKAAATMVLTDDNFATLVSAVRQGRTLYDNIVKFVRFQLSTTIGAILTVLLAPLLGLADPFTAVQILWIAIIMDGPPAVSLALDAARPGIMHEPPRARTQPLLTLARLARVAAYGLTMTVGTLAVTAYAASQGMSAQAPTLAFTTFVLFQFFNVFNSRVESGTAFNRYFFKNTMLWTALVGVIGLQVIAVQWPPAQALFGTQPLSLANWALAAAVASSILVLEESRKLGVFLFAKLVTVAQTLRANRQRQNRQSTL